MNTPTWTQKVDAAYAEVREQQRRLGPTEIKAVNGKWTCPYCPAQLDATDGYASEHNFTLHLEGHKRGAP